MALAQIAAHQVAVGLFAARVYRQHLAAQGSAGQIIIVIIIVAYQMVEQVEIIILQVLALDPEGPAGEVARRNLELLDVKAD